MEQNTTFLNRLIHSFNTAITIEDAARRTLEFADQICAWDFASLEVRSRGEDYRPILNLEKKSTAAEDQSERYVRRDESRLHLPVGSKLAWQTEPSLISVSPGTTQMIAPIRIEPHGIGFLVVSRNGDKAYCQQDLEALQWIACLSAGTFQRLLLQESFDSTLRRFQLLTENGMDSIAELTVDGIICYYGQSSERIIGWDPEDLEGRNAFDLIHPDDLPGIQGVFLDMFRNPGAIKMAEYRFRHKNGSWCVIESVGKCLPDTNGVSRLIVNSRDITERRKLEARLSTAARMETVGKLAGGIAHDCNNVFMAISCFTELLESKMEQGNLQFPEVSEIKKATAEGAGLVQKLLAFGQKQISVPRILDLNQMIQEESSTFASLVGRKNELALDLQEGIHRIKADRSLLIQAVMNLCANAGEAMEQGGKLSIRTQNVYLGEDFVRNHIGSSTGDFVLLEVSDNGCGMTDDMLRHVFEPFYTTKHPAKGVGLGLSSVYGIVKQNQGYILCESKKGMGTTFQIFLPRTNEVSP